MTGSIDLWYLAVGSFWAWRAARACLGLQRVPFLPPSPGATALDRTTAIVIARDLPSARAVVASLRQQGSVPLDVVVVDETPNAAAAELATEGVRVVSPDGMPPGWLPRSYALASGVAAASDSEWLLVLDEPLAFTSPDTLACLIAHARRQRADALALVPRTPAGWFAPLVLSGLIDTLPAMAATNRDRAGVPWLGPTSLIRSRAIANIGGFEAVRMAPVAELMIGELLLQSDQRLRVVQVQDEATLARPVSRAALVETLERLLGIVGFRVWLLLLALGFYALLWGTAVAGAFAADPWGWWAFGGLAAQLVPALWIARAHRTPWPAALLVPWILPIEVALSLATAVRLRWRRGVTWQGRFVSIDSLRDRTPDSEG